MFYDLSLRIKNAVAWNSTQQFFRLMRCALQIYLTRTSGINQSKYSVTAKRS